MDIASASNQTQARRQMIDESADRRRQAAPGGEDDMDDTNGRLPLGEDMDQTPLHQFQLADMIGEQGDPHTGDCRVPYGLKVGASHARFVPDAALQAIGTGKFPIHNTAIVR